MLSAPCQAAQDTAHQCATDLRSYGTHHRFDRGLRHRLAAAIAAAESRNGPARAAVAARRLGGPTLRPRLALRVSLALCSRVGGRLSLFPQDLEGGFAIDGLVVLARDRADAHHLLALLRRDRAEPRRRRADQGALHDGRHTLL